MAATERRIQRRLQRRRRQAPELLRRDRALPTADQQLSIVSWNMLAHHLVRPEQRPQVNLTWPRRFGNFQLTLAPLRASIVCLQELGTEEAGDVCAFMATIGYEPVVRVRGHIKPGASGMSNAVFFRRDEWTAQWVEHGNRAMAVGLQETAATERTLTVINVHLEGNPRKFRDRQNGLHSIFQRARKHTAAGQPVVVCGDFNHPLHGTIAEYLLQGSLAAGATDGPQDTVVTSKDLQHDFGLCSAYPAGRAGLGLPTIVDRPGDCATIDHVLYSSASLRCTGFLEPAAPDQLQAHLQTGLPSSAHSSDHLPVGGTFQFL